MESHSNYQQGRSSIIAEWHRAATVVTGLRSRAKSLFEVLSSSNDEAVAEDILPSKLEADNNATKRQSNLDAIREQLSRMSEDVAELERSANVMQNYPPLVNSYMLATASALALAHDASLSKTDAAGAHMRAMGWFQHARAFSEVAFSMHQQLGTMRQHQAIAARWRRELPNSRYLCLFPNDITSDQVRAMLMKIDGTTFFQESPSVFSVHLMVAKTMQCIIVLRNFSVENVVVLAIHEAAFAPDGRLRTSVSSRYLAFRKVTQFAKAASLHFTLSAALPNQDIPVNRFLAWLTSYATLFSNQCERCGHVLRNGLPPVYRDYRNCSAFHEDCRQ